MALTDATLNLMADYLASLATHAAIHTALPNSSGSNPSSAARQPIAWDAASGSGDMTLSVGESFTGGASGGPATHVGLWTAITGGTFLGAYALTGDQTFNAAGEYDLLDIVINGSAS